MMSRLPWWWSNTMFKLHISNDKDTRLQLSWFFAFSFQLTFCSFAFVSVQTKKTIVRKGKMEKRHFLLKCMKFDVCAKCKDVDHVIFVCSKYVVCELKFCSGNCYCFRLIQSVFLGTTKLGDSKPEKKTILIFKTKFESFPLQLKQKMYTKNPFHDINRMTKNETKRLLKVKHKKNWEIKSITEHAWCVYTHSTHSFGLCLVIVQVQLTVFFAHTIGNFEILKWYNFSIHCSKK